MRTFHCERCQARLFFENSSCESCGAAVAFQPSTNSFRAVDVDEAGAIVAQETANPVVFCSNRLHPAACNWLVEDGQPLCLSCRTTKVLPNLADATNCENVRKIETAKRRLVYSLNAWGLPFPNKQEDADHGVEFHFLEQVDPQQKVLTGHDNGVITLNVAEADDATRERVRAEMHESYRTLLGHLRHEVGHYYWDRLIANTPWQDDFRALFGDEQVDYGEALKKHYSEPVTDWAARFVSSYASSHPWEDWAECWAHYMHLRDAMETAASWGLRLDNAVPGLEPVVTAPLPEHGSARQAIVEHWLPTSQFINAMSRSLGTHDSYPFVVPDPVLEKLEFIHRVVHAGVSGQVAMNFQAAEVPEQASDAA